MYRFINISISININISLPFLDHQMEALHFRNDPFQSRGREKEKHINTSKYKVFNRGVVAVCESLCSVFIRFTVVNANGVTH